MQFFILPFFTVLTLIINRVCAVQENYYWRDYKGTIPEDAVIGGKNSDGDPVYIGQAVSLATGLIPVQIDKGKNDVGLALEEKVSRVKEHIKILCGPSQNFYWLPANSTDLHLILLDDVPVIGGYTVGWGVNYVGRITVGNDTVIGRILQYNVGSAEFFYEHDGKAEQFVKSYEILLYDDSLVDLRSV